MNKYMWILIGCLLLFSILLFSQYGKASQYDKTNADNKQRDAAIVLGASLWHNEPSPALRERLNRALQLYRTGKIKYIILAGGLGDDEQQSEAQAMKTYLLGHGVPAEKMILEDKSRNTKENLSNTKFLLNNKPIHSLYLVTHDYHMYRALIYAQQADLRVAPAPAHSTVLFEPYHKLRECAALWKLYLFH
jgi:uncharacterized SAM-binding protein YcdF (DUF218 family)